MSSKIKVKYETKQTMKRQASDVLCITEVLEKKTPIPIVTMKKRLKENKEKGA